MNGMTSEIKNLQKFLKLKDQEIRRQVYRRKIAINQRNWMILIVVITIVLKVIEWTV